MAQNTFNPINILDTTEADGVGSGGSLTIGGGASIGKNFYVGGNLSISGTTTSFSDNILVVNKDPANSVDTGIIFQRHVNDIDNNKNYAGIIYSEQNDSFNLGYVTSDIGRGYATINNLIPINVKDITTGNINISGDLYKNGVLYSPGGTQWSSVNSDIYYTTGKVITGDLTSTNISAANLRLTGDLYVSGTTYTLNITTTNVSDINISTGTINVSGLGTLTNVISINTTTATLNASTGITSASAQITNMNVTTGTVGTILATNVSATTITTAALLNTNAVSTNITTATLNASTGITAASAQITNANVTTLTAATLLNTNSVSTNVTTATLNASTGITAASAQITNANVTTLTAATLLNTNAVSTNVTTATLNASTGITAPSAQITNANVTTLTAATLLNTNSVSTNVTTATLNASTGITSATLLVTGLVSTANLFATTSTIPNIIHTNVTTATLNASTGITSASAEITNLNAISFTASNLLANNVNTGVSSIFSGSFSASNNTSTPANVTGFSFVNANTRYFQSNVTVTILRSSGGNLYQNFIIEGIQTDSGWSLYTSKLGDESNVTFTITSSGQIQYTSTNITNFISSTVRYSVTQISNTGSYSFAGMSSQGTVLIDSMQIQNTQNSIIGTNTGSLYVLGGSTLSKTVNILTTENAIGLGTGGGLTVFGGGAFSKDLFVGGNLTVANLEVSGLTDTLNFTGTNITTATLNATGITADTLLVTGLVSSANVFATTSTIPNVVHTNVTTATLNASTGITSASAQIINANVTTLTAATLLNTNAVSTNVTSATLNASTGITTATLLVTGLVSSANLFATTSTIPNVVHTNVTTATLNASTGITSAALLVTGLVSTANLFATTSTIPNIVNTNVTTATLNASTGITTSTAQITNANVTTLTAATAIITTNLLAIGNSNTIGNVFTTGGNVGISTTSPSEVLDVNGNIRYTGCNYVSSSTLTTGSAGTILIATSIGIGLYSGRITVSASGGGGTGHSQFTIDISATFTETSVTNTPSVIIKRSQWSGGNNVTNVTICTAPADGTYKSNYFLTCAAGVTLQIKLIERVGGILTLTTPALTTLTEGYIQTVYPLSSIGVLHGAFGNYLNVNTGGVGINSTNTSNALDVTGTARVTTSVTTGAVFATNLVGGNSNTIGNIFTTGGNVGIGTNSPSYKLDAVGNLRLSSTLPQAILLNQTVSTTASYIDINNTVARGIFGLDGLGYSTLTQRLLIATWSNHPITFATNTVDRITISADGNVGIGTSSPGTTLDVTGTARITTSLSAVGNSNTIGNIFTTGGNVGIGTANPTSALQVNGTVIGTSLRIITTGTGGSGAYTTAVSYYQNGNNDRFFVGVDGSGLTGYNGQANLYTYDLPIVFYPGATEKVRFTSSGNVGIGTNSPQTTLDVTGTARITTSITTGAMYATNSTVTNFVATNASVATLNLSTGVTSAALLVTDLISTANIFATTSTLPNTIHTNVTTATLNASTGITTSSAQITNSNVTTETVGTAIITTSLLAVGNSNTVGSIFTTGGNVGISTTAPGYNLDVSGNVNFTGILYQNGNVFSANSQWVSSSENIYYTNGNVGIGTTSPQNTLDVTGTARITTNLTTGAIYATNSTITNVNITNLSTGSVVVSGNTTFGSNVLVAGPVLQIPTGNIASRPNTPASGYIRYNTETSQFEGYGPGNAWGSLGGVVDIAQTTKILASETPSVTDGNLYFYTVGSERARINSAGNIGIGTSSPGTTLDVSGTARVTTSITTGAMYATNSTVTNFVATNASAATINLSTGVTAATAQITNANVTTLTVATLLNTNVVSTNASAATLNLSTGVTSVSAQITNANVTTLTAATAQITNANVTTITAATLLNTNAVSTNVTTATLNASTGITAPSAQITNANVTTLTAATLMNTNIVSTNVSAATLNLLTGVTAASAQITNSNVTTETVGTARITTNLSAVGNSNTIGNIFTTGGNVGIGTANPTSALQVNGTVIGTSLQIITTGTGGSGAYTTAVSYYQNGNNDRFFVGVDGSGLTGYNGQANLYTYDLPIVFYPGATEKVRFTSSGNVGIGTNSPQTTLDVTGTARVTTSITTGAMYATNSTVTNFVATNASVATLNLSTGVTAASAQFTNANVTTITAGGLFVTNGNIALSKNGSTNNNSITFTNNYDTMFVGMDGVGLTGAASQGTLFTYKTPITFHPGASQSVTFQTNGNVGIANSSPSNTLDVTGTARITTSITTGAVYATNSTVTNAVATTSSAGTAVATTYTGGSMSLSGNLTIAGTFTIENISAGSTLTATNANATTLTAATLLNTNMISTNITTATLNASTGITTSSAQITNSNVTTETVGTARITTNLLAVGNSNTVGSIFTTGGNVGIGTVFPVAPLHVVGTTSATSTTAGGIFMGTLTDNNTFIKLNSTTGSYIDFSGNNNDYRGRILYNNASDYMDFSTNTTSVARMDSVGNLTMTGDITAFGSLSDRRLKENIMNIPSDIALDKVKSLRPVTFNWRDDIFNESARGQSDVGFIAQEVESIIPYAVSNYSEINSGEMYKRIKHERIIPYLIAAVQTLDIERSRQNLEIERLTNIIHLLNERLANIEQQYQI